MLQFGIGIRSIEVSKQKLRDSECFPVSIGVCAVFLSRKTFRNSTKGLDKRLFTMELQSSVFVFFVCLFVLFFIFLIHTVKLEINICNNTAVYWACAGKSTVYCTYIFIFCELCPNLAMVN